MSKVIFESTADGSHTLYVPELDEHYHSTNGAVQESTHVFIEAGLKRIEKNDIKILEIGFGTGLNTLLTLKNKGDKQIDYHTFELYPLPYSIVDKLNYAICIDESLLGIFNQMHQQEWNTTAELSKDFLLTKIEADFSLLGYSHTCQYDLVYFDAFAPNKQEEMWTEAIFNHLYSITASNGVLVTYCAKGSVRRMLQNSGYFVERLPGPPGKREMLRATKK